MLRIIDIPHWTEMAKLVDLTPMFCVRNQTLNSSTSPPCSACAIITSSSKRMESIETGHDPLADFQTHNPNPKTLNPKTLNPKSVCDQGGPQGTSGLHPVRFPPSARRRWLESCRGSQQFYDAGPDGSTRKRREGCSPCCGRQDLRGIP